MEALFIFIAKSSGLLVMFYCAYYFLLRKETFFTSNRWFLLAGLITSVVLPFLVYTRIIWVDPTPLENIGYSNAFSAHDIQKSAFDINWNYILIAIYAIGLLTLIIKFALDFYSLNSVLKGKKIKQQADFKFVDVSENIAPFSYFDYIVYNSSMYSASELENIIEHEKVHSEQNHTIDVLISRVFCVLFWFNPIIWLYKKAIVQNLEFIADKEAAKKISDKKAYQYTLLKITTHDKCVAITNHFYQSLIKKRIIMLNKNQSKKRNSWKYYVVIPALAAFVFLFQIEVIAKEKRETTKETTKEIAKGDKSIDVYKIKKTTTDQQLKEIAEKLKLNHNVDFKVSGIERNSSNELTAIKVDVKRGSEENQAFSIAGNKAIKDCGVVIVTEEDGSVKISLITDNQVGEAKTTDKEHKVEIKKVATNSKNNSNTNVNTNTITSSQTNNNTNDNTSVTVTSSVNGNVIVSTNTNTQSNVKVSGFPLYVVDGKVIGHVSEDEINSINSSDIKSVSVFKGPEATVKYGEEGKDGVIVIETKK
jgi:hypothetical protein